MWTSLHVCVYVRMYTCVHMYMLTCSHVSIYIGRHMYTCVCCQRTPILVFVDELMEENGLVCWHNAYGYMCVGDEEADDAKHRNLTHFLVQISFSSALLTADT